MIGLSLSFCIQDVLNGKVRVVDIDKIISGTKMESEADCALVISEYIQVYWVKNPRLAKDICLRLFNQNKIEQPRLLGLPIPSLQGGVWVERMDQVIFVNPL